MNTTHSNTGYTESLQQKRARARNIIIAYTAAAMVKGAIPVPASSALIVANNAALFHHIQSIFGVPFSLGAVAGSIPTAALMNVAARTVFVEGARALSWGTGMPWGSVLVSGLGATTAAVQTATVGLIAMAVAENGGRPLSQAEQESVLAPLTELLKDARNARATA